MATHTLVDWTDKDNLAIKSGGSIDIESGATLEIAGTAITSTAAELNLVDNQAADVTFAYAAGGANVSEVTITVVDAAGTAIAAPFNLDVWLSDAATGVGLTSTSASGTVQAKSASGADFEVMSAKKAIRVQTLATGIYILEITDSAKTTFYPAATVPGTGATAVGAIMATGDYGAEAMKVRMQTFWCRNIVRDVGDVIDSEGGPHDPSFASSADEIRYHLDAGHAVPVVEKPQRATPPKPEARKAPPAKAEPVAPPTPNLKRRRRRK